MLPLRIFPDVLAKLTDRHKVSENEISQCFENCEGGYLQDTREEHTTNPPTLWFVAFTNRNRKLKIMFVLDEGIVHIKSAYDATLEVERIYKKYA